MRAADSSKTGKWALRRLRGRGLKLRDYNRDGSRKQKPSPWVLPLFFLFMAGLAAADNYQLQIGFDVIEAGKKPEKTAVLMEIDNIVKRDAGGKYKYSGGGKFTLAEGYESAFESRQKDSSLLLRADYQRLDAEYFNVRYDARIVYPYLESEIRFANKIRIKQGETILISESKLPDGTYDTRPYWVILRIYLQEPVFAEGSFGGIGAVLNIKDGYPYITELHSGGPAQRAGINVGDRILQVDGVEMLGRNLQDVINLIRGKPYTSVNLKISSIEKGNPRGTRILSVERWILKQ